MKTVASALLAVLLTAAPAMAGEVTGTYKVRGWNPGTPAASTPSYGGTLTVTKQAEGYIFQWLVGKSVNKGVGFMKVIGGKTWLAASYANQGQAASVLYEVSADGKKLIGEWVGDGCRLGREEATR